MLRAFAATIRGGFGPDLTSINASLTKGIHQHDGNDLTPLLQFNVIHFALMGQSQLEGYRSTPPLTTATNSRALTLSPNSSGRSPDTSTGTLILLQEVEDVALELGETIGTSMAQQLLSYIGDTSYKIVVTNHALGAQTIQGISKGGSSGKYEEAIAACQRVKTLSDINGDNYEVHMIFSHGGSGLNPYETALDTLKSDFRADVALLTNKTVAIFGSQQRDVGNPDYSIQVINSFDNDANAHLSHPQYNLDYQNDNVHLTNHGTRNSAMLFARAINKVLFGSGFDVLRIDSNNIGFSNGDLTIPLLNADGGTISGTPDIEVYNSTDAEVLTGSFAISGTNLVFTPDTEPNGSKLIELRVNQNGDGTLKASSSDTTIFTDAGSQPYSLDKFLPRQTESIVVEFNSVTVSGNLTKGTYQSQGFDFTPDIVDQQITAKLDFSRTIAAFDSSWNAMAFHPHLNIGTSFPIKNINNQTTPWAYIPVSGWASLVGDSSADAAGTTTGDDSGFYPDSVLIGYHFSNNAVSVSKFTGLDNGKTYTIKFMGSRVGVTGRITEYDIQGVKKTIAIGNNTTTIVEFNNVSPIGGEIAVTLTDVGSEVYTYLNASEIIQEVNAALITTILTRGNYVSQGFDLTHVLGGAAAINASLTKGTYQAEGFDFTLDIVGQGIAAKLDFSKSNLAIDSSWTALAFNPHNFLGVSFPITDTDGLATPWDYIPQSGWGVFSGVTASNDAGTVTGADSGIYPDAALIGYHFSDGLVSVSRITGLNDTKTYTIKIISSRTGVTGRITRYTINGASQDLAMGNNTANLVEFNNIQPTGGIIDVTLTDVGDQTFTYINVMEIIEE